MDQIPESLRPLAFPIDQLQHDPRNARMHSERNLDAVKSSLQRFGWRNVIVAREDRTVVAGNARLDAARSLGWTHAPVLFVAEDARASMAYAIADNRTAELADWKLDELAKQLAELDVGDDLLAAVGFNDDELANLLAADWQTTTASVEDFERKPKAASQPKETRSIVVTLAEWQAITDALAKAREIEASLRMGEFLARLCR